MLQLCLPIGAFHQRVVVNISSAPVCIGCKYNTSMAWGKEVQQGATATKREDDELTMCLQHAARMCG